MISHLVAVGTVSGFGVCQRPVRLPMPGQVAGRAVTFSAIRTLTFLVVGRLLRSRFRSYRVVTIIVFLQFHNTKYYMMVKTFSGNLRHVLEKESFDRIVHQNIRIVKKLGKFKYVNLLPCVTYANVTRD